MSEKEHKTKRKTKAGMLGDAGENESGKDVIESKKDPDNTPKISKEKATEREDDRPVH